MKEMLNTIFKNIKNIPGKKSQRKIVVFSVDDYGSLRVKNRESYQLLKTAGIPMDNGRFSRYDTLADQEDLVLLFEILNSVKDSLNHAACFTAFANVANPDFEKIKESGFNTYHRELFTKTLNRYGDDYKGVFELWKQGIAENIFYPAYHGTEHINVKRFMEALQTGHKSVSLAFVYESVCVPAFPDEKAIQHATTTFYIEKAEENEFLIKDIEIGTQMFEDLFGFRSKSFTPGAGIYSPLLNKTFAENGIKYIHVNRYQAYPLGDGKFSKKFLYNGKSNEFGQKYIVRNCVFEPDGKDNLQAANRCLDDIEAAFRRGAPANISSHRVNFVGRFDTEYRDNSLKQLKFLLNEIVKRWPEVEFMNADEMADAVL